ncbi:hypothetical protein PCARR_a1421 [Pseudoalteromonas carrageenovora IAM 12662]|uniref:Uncharacterized protein n=1 Tax=Pseudoalteromonas carrageenovora IAM 12662 TaxID=1314868 RepID=A0ABR9ERD9_PSEVC|nr:hypothetical protein [Pseudoalteromonas carrageenovora IAM 12662]
MRNSVLVKLYMILSVAILVTNDNTLKNIKKIFTVYRPVMLI